MEIRATQKFVRMSPRKLRLVVPLVKNLPPTRAVEVLPHVGKRAAGPLGKVIKTAIANAKIKKISDSDLVFKEIQINEGPRLKRWKPGARGRTKPYQRKMSHIRVVLQTKEPEAIKEARKKLGEESSKSRTGKSGEKPATQRSLRSLRILKKEGRLKKGVKRKNQRKSATKSA